MTDTLMVSILILAIVILVTNLGLIYLIKNKQVILKGDTGPQGKPGAKGNVGAPGNCGCEE